ncbi:hypothetical protein [Confluentibacter lentus]|uniref:hypothetical protein n=1 Tax=Confluentibacter lentus TaxID=1699412 RepID=UPI000C28894A|nr:hypothetical protein [Confluentibacter lentus]
MNTEIGIALIIGITIGTTSLIWKSENFTYSQKVFLTICFLFPPLQWILAILIYFFNTTKNSSSNNYKYQHKTEKSKISINEQKQSIQILKDKGVLTETEYQEKINIIEEQIIIDKIHKSTEYQNLKNIYESELLTKEQFDEKVNKLIANYKEYYPIFGENNYPEFTWELFQNMKINKKINPYNYQNSDLLGKWKFKNGQLFLYNENGLNKLKVTWLNNVNRYGEWDLSNNLLNVKLNKSLGFDKEFFHIDELGSHIFVYFVNDKKYTCIKDLSEYKNVW